MNSKFYLNLEKLISMNFEKETVSRYKWCEETTKKSWYGKKTTIPAGWKYSEKSEITSLENLKECDRYRLDNINKIVYNKARVTFNMDDEIRLWEWFNSDDDALKFIEDLITKSGKQFQVFDEN